MWLCFPYPKDLLDGEVVQYVCVSAAHWDYSTTGAGFVIYTSFSFLNWVQVPVLQEPPPLHKTHPYVLTAIMAVSSALPRTLP